MLIKVLTDYERTILKIQEGISTLDNLLTVNNTLIDYAQQEYAIKKGGLFSNFGGKYYSRLINSFKEERQVLINKYMLAYNNCASTFINLQSLITLSDSQKSKLIDSLIEKSNTVKINFSNYVYRVTDNNVFIKIDEKSKLLEEKVLSQAGMGSLGGGYTLLKILAEEEERLYRETKLLILQRLNELNEKLIKLKLVAKYKHDEALLLFHTTENMRKSINKLKESMEHIYLEKEHYERCLIEKQMLELFTNSLIKNTKDFKGHISKQQIVELAKFKEEFEKTLSFKIEKKLFKWQLLT